MGKIGFTGTRNGTTKAQWNSLLTCFHIHIPVEFHHGLCVGADTEAHNLVRENFHGCKIIGHPPTKKKSYVYSICDEFREPKDYIARDKDIVDESDILFATPLQDTEILRSGTWTTVRYARKKNKRIYIIKRNGEISFELPSQQTFLEL